MAIEHELIQTAIVAGDAELAHKCLIDSIVRSFDDPEDILHGCNGDQEVFYITIATDEHCDWTREELGDAADLILDEDEDEIWVGTDVAIAVLAKLGIEYNKGPKTDY